RIEEYLSLVAYDHYGLTEMCGPGVAAECQERNGLHVWTDHFYPEVVDPKTGESLESGETGELVLTTLSREATPIVRFRTGDITSLKIEPCVCDRSFPRISRIRGRTDDMLKVKGTIVYPRQIEEVILGLPDIGNAWEIVVERKPRRMDSLTLRAEAASANVDTSSLRRELGEKLRQRLFLRVKVEILEVGALPRFEGKARRVVDLREL
ncbi:MAG: phenylacetate--CoA ligase family protein, partial [Candidatus Geothermarchaeales archaeon]